MPARAVSRDRSDVERSVPSSFADSGITLFVVPASMRVTVSTTGSKASMRLVTKLWSASAISHATGTGSRVSCGMEA